MQILYKIYITKTAPSAVSTFSENFGVRHTPENLHQHPGNAPLRLNFMRLSKFDCRLLDNSLRIDMPVAMLERQHAVYVCLLPTQKPQKTSSILFYYV